MDEDVAGASGRGGANGVVRSPRDQEALRNPNRCFRTLENATSLQRSLRNARYCITGIPNTF